MKSKLNSGWPDAPYEWSWNYITDEQRQAAQDKLTKMQNDTRNRLFNCEADDESGDEDEGE